MNSTLPSTGANGNMSGNATTPSGNTAENDNVQGNRDLAIVFALIALAVPFFVVSLRVFHPRRIAKFSAHDYLLFTAMFFGLVATVGMITELRFGVQPKGALVGRNALIATIATTMEFFTSVTLGRLSAMLFALKEFGDKVKRPCRETIINRVIIISILVGASVQGTVAVITTIASCSPVSSVVEPALFGQDCRFYNHIQVVHAATDFWKNSIIIILFIVLYMRRGSSNRLRYLKYIILTVGMITCFCGLARTIFLRRHAQEDFPPLQLITPKLLLVLEMDLVLTTVGILTISTAILPRQSSQSHTEAGSRKAGYYGEVQNKGQANVTTTWDNLPDLEFQSDNPYNDFKNDKLKNMQPKMSDQGTMTSPSLMFHCPGKAILRQLPASSSHNPIPRSVQVTSRDIRPVSRSSIKSVDLFIPPLPFAKSSGSLMETPAHAERMLAYPSSRLSTTSSASSSDLSSGPFSEDEDEIVVQPSTNRPQSVADHTRQASVVVTGRISSWGIHEVEIGPRSQSQ